jgi:hypothetical protein
MDNLLLALVVQVIHLEYLNLIQQKTYQEIHLLSLKKTNIFLSDFNENKFYIHTSLF